MFGSDGGPRQIAADGGGGVLVLAGEVEHFPTSVNRMNPGTVLTGESEKVMVSFIVDMASVVPVFS